MSPENAAKQLERLESQILSLDKMPERFPRYGKEPWYSRGLRFVEVDNYIVFYIPDIKEQVVTVLRVMYSGRNIEERLSDHTKQ
ncbi:type II toxin-antitoxin system RelE/ParE family toxin [Enterococcus cecorum]|uniref:type II toxin-antitoxin system RelE/ParE family toxin n=1 Tax=Enterococcus cecorum TaxID=44008 RepID=UPI000A93A871